MLMLISVRVRARCSCEYQLSRSMTSSQIDLVKGRHLVQVLGKIQHLVGIMHRREWNQTINLISPSYLLECLMFLSASLRIEWRFWISSIEGQLLRNWGSENGWLPSCCELLSLSWLIMPTSSHFSCSISSTCSLREVDSKLRNAEMKAFASQSCLGLWV